MELSKSNSPVDLVLIMGNRLSHTAEKKEHFQPHFKLPILSWVAFVHPSNELFFLLFFTEKSEAARSGGCFDEASLVYTRIGPLEISQLNIGDEILSVTPEGELEYSEVLLFLDRNPTAKELYYEIETESGAIISITPAHLIFVSEDNSTEFERQISRATYAKNVQIGQFLYTSSIIGDKTMMMTISDNRIDGMHQNQINNRNYAVLERVVRVDAKIKKGIYAPLTRDGTLIVNNIAASCYAIIHDQTIAHWSFLPVRVLENLKDSLLYLAKTFHLVKLNNKSAKSAEITIQNGVHWYPKLLYSLSKYLIPQNMMY